MAIPLPNLDTRTWKDLVEEGRAQIPVAAGEWTDHNVHDPGITIMELMAWVTESSMYTANTVSPRHLRKFLALAGFRPNDPLPARTVLSLTRAPGSPTVTVPAGVCLRPVGGGPLFRTLHSVVPTDTALSRVAVFDGALWTSVGEALRDGQCIAPWGTNPAATASDETDPAFYLGFDAPLPVGDIVRLHVHVDGGDAGERAALVAEADLDADRCQSREWICATAAPVDGLPVPLPGLPPSAGAPVPPPPRHHGLESVWEWRSVDQWLPIGHGGGEARDETRGFTLDGSVRLTVPGVVVAHRLPGDDTDRFWVRCRLTRGRPDSAPRMAAMSINAVEVVQSTASTDRIPVAAGASAPPVLPSGFTVPLALRIDHRGIAREVVIGLEGSPEAFVVDYQAPTAVEDGFLESTLVRVASEEGIRGVVASGLPEQTARLADAPLVHDSVRLWSVETSPSTRLSEWSIADDLEAAGTVDRRLALFAEEGMVEFGDGVRGVAPPAGASLVATYHTTLGANGNVARGTVWEFDDSPYNSALLGGGGTAALSELGVTNPVATEGGKAAEPIGSAAERAARCLWAHERLVELAATHRTETLDQLDVTVVSSREAPARAGNVLDFERLALTVPGARVRRVRAWAGMDPRLGCLEAPGTVTVVVVPELPLGRPTPTAGLLEHVRAWLNKRRVMGTRLHVSGPLWVDLVLKVVVRGTFDADPAALGIRVDEVLRTYLDPLRGGPAGAGWPLGRNVHVPELLRVVDGVLGVDYVQTLEVTADGVDESCGFVCVPTTGLVSPGEIDVEVIA